MIPLQQQDGRAEGHAKCLTRLVLPIRYCFSAEGPRLAEEDPELTDPAPFDRDFWRYERIPPENLEHIWRRSAYFTVDTSYALFSRAEWYRLKSTRHEAIWSSFVFAAPLSRTIAVEIDPPTLVLFERPQTRESGKRTPCPDAVFQIGFVILDCRLRSKDPGSQIFLEDLIEFNERVRCIFSPYAGYLDGYLATMAACNHLCSTSDGSFLALWAAAIGYPVAVRPLEKAWITTRKMRKSAQAWISGCARAHMRGDCGSSEGLAVPPDSADAETHTGWLASTDYRAFVWTYAYTKGDLCHRFGGAAERPEKHGHWVKLLNVDAISDYRGRDDLGEADANQTTRFEQEWAQQRTYYRWAHLGTYYGVSPHSGAMLTSNPYPTPRLDLYFRTLYFDQALLLLYLRVYAFQLSIRMASLSAQIGDRLARSKHGYQREKTVEQY